MSQQDPSSSTWERGPQGDPWHAFGYIVSGVAVYGFGGWVADQWLGTGFLVAVGILLGACLGIYLTISRFDALPRTPRDPHEADAPADQQQRDQQPDQTPDQTQ